MAGTQRKSGVSRSQYGKVESGRTYVYVDGTAVRKLEPAPIQETQKEQKPSVSHATRKNRERALSMNLGYVIFLTAAAIFTVFTCVNFLQLQAQETRLQKEVTSLETKLNTAILENDSDYNRIMAGVDMEMIKDVAINELGMVYAKKSQIVTYEIEDSDYVRQYAEVPEE